MEYKYYKTVRMGQSAIKKEAYQNGVLEYTNYRFIEGNIFTAEEMKTADPETGIPQDVDITQQIINKV